MNTIAALEPTSAAADPSVGFPKPAGQRSLLVDVVRGLAISLVALGHTNQGVMRREWWGNSNVGLQLNNFIYSFHMPAFFLISGIFITQSVAKRGPSAFISTKVKQMMYPYLLWCILIYALAFPLARFMAYQPPLPGKYLIQILTGDVLWFLPTLFFAVLLGMLLRKVPMPLLFGAAAATSLWMPDIHINFIDRGLKFFVFLVTGMWLGRRYETLEKTPVLVAAPLAILIGFAALMVTNSSWLTWRYAFIPLGLAGTYMLFLLARCATKSGFARLVAWIGEASFGVYLMSSYAQGLGREFLLRVFHSANPYAQAIVPTLLAILIPAYIYQHRVRFRLNWLFVWPF